MRSSPIQLLETTLVKISVEAVEDKKFEDRFANVDFAFDNIELQTSKQYRRIDDFWDGGLPPVPGIEKRTYLVSLGIRTPPDVENVGPYKFEIVFSGVVAVVPEMDAEKANMMASQYGLTLLYGVIREQMSMMSSRMQWGHVMLPTMSFIDEKLKIDESPQTAINKESIDPQQ